MLGCVSLVNLCCMLTCCVLILFRCWLLRRRWQPTQCTSLPRRTRSTRTQPSVARVWKTHLVLPAPSGSAWWREEDRWVPTIRRSTSDQYLLIDELLVWFREWRRAPSVRGSFPRCRTSDRKFPSLSCFERWASCQTETSWNTSSTTLTTQRWWRWSVWL